MVLSARSESNLAATIESILKETRAYPDRLGALDVLMTNNGEPPKIGCEETTVERVDDTSELASKDAIVAIDAAMSTVTDGGAITNSIATAAQQPEANHVLAPLDPDRRLRTL